MTKCNHGIHPYCIGRRCKCAEPLDDGETGICVLDYRYSNPEDDEEDDE